MHDGHTLHTSITDMDFKNVALTVAGWGKTRQGAMTSSRYLLETKVKMVDGEKCRKSAIYRDNLVTDTMMCAYSLGKDACQVSPSSQKKIQRVNYLQTALEINMIAMQGCVDYA